MKALGFTTFILATALFETSCSTGELDGRKYAHNSPSPVQGKMGITYKRVKADNPVAEETTARTVESDGLLGALTGPNNQPPGLFDSHETPDEPRATYWIKG